MLLLNVLKLSLLIKKILMNAVKFWRNILIPLLRNACHIFHQLLKSIISKEEIKQEILLNP